MQKTNKNLRFFAVILFTLALLTALTVLTVSAEDAIYLYVNSETGNDRSDGESPENAVRTFTQACRLGANAGYDKAYLVFTNAYSIPKTVKEIEHPDVEFVLTTKDETTDYAETVGAKIVYGSGLRYYLYGDTTFDNMTFEYTKSVVFVAQYNHITFGEGIRFKRLDADVNVLYIVGGWQSPLDDFDTTKDSHITIRGGDFEYVIGGSRQKGTGASGTTYFGTNHIEMSGGKVAKMFGGSYANQISTSAVINITGGEVGVLYAAGDATRRLESDGTVTLSGGTIGDVHMNNIIGTATLTLDGAKVGSVDMTYANAEQTTNARKANKPDTLYYNAQYYTKEEIAAFGAAFDNVENISKVYAKSGASGTGASEDDPTSFEKAVKIASEAESVIVLIGTQKLTDFTEPAHDNTIVIEGASSTATLEIDGTYTFGGKTEFRDMRLSGKGTLNAKKGTAVIDASVGAYFTYNVIGSAELYAGKIGTVTDAGYVLINGAEVGSVTGGTDAFTLEILGGKVGAIKTTDSSIATAKLAVSGGTVDKITFNNVTKELSYLLYGGEVKEYAVEGTNVTGELQLDTAKFTVDSLGAAASIFKARTDVVYFLSDAGNGNGTSANAAGNSLADAFAAIGDNNGTIVVVGPYVTPVLSHTGSGFIVPKHAGEITITSVYDGVDYRKSADAALIITQNIYLGGDTVIDGLRITNKKSYGGILAAYNDLFIGADVVTDYAGTVLHYPSLVGGTYEAVQDVACEIVVNGGNWQRVRLGNSTGIPVNANVHMTINDGYFAETVTLSTASTHTGDLTLVVNGGTFVAGITGAAMSKDEYSFTGNMTIEVNDGDIYGRVRPTSTEFGSFNGTYNVIIRDQNPVHTTEFVGTKGLKGEITSTLSVGENVDINADVVGTTSFTSLVRESPNGADPWLFFHDGYYYYIATAAGKGLQLAKAPNLSDLLKAESKQIYKPEKGHEWSAHLWSPEIHYFSAEEIGAEYAGWYCFLGSQPDDAWHEANGAVDDPAGFGEQRAHVIKCLTDDLQGPWGHPITGEPNVPQKIQFPDSDFNVNELTGGCSVITINGVKYITFISEVGRETSGTADMNFYQTINIAKFTNPWTIEGQPTVICKPEYDWEKGGSEDGIHPQVVEGSTAVYGPNGEVYIIYSGSGYWTSKYQLGQLTYIGGANGDPTDPASWSKKPTSIFSQSAELTGCGHASYVTDTDGQGWICYHAYPKGDNNRRAYVEPYYFTEEGVVIGNRSGHPAPVSTVYTAKANPLPIAKRIVGFDQTDAAKETFAFTREYDGRFTDVTNAHWFFSFVEKAYRIGLANGTSNTKFSPDNTFTVAQALTAATNIHKIYNAKEVRAAAAGEKWYDPYVEYCVQNGIITAGQFANLDANITRGDMAIVFANVLPESEYTAVRRGSNPDVTEDMSCYKAVAKLYNAGIVGGDAGTGNYRPNDSIKRSEACVIFTRIALQGERAKG